ncbi:MAG: HAMP domain-containing histidine kinase [Phycisphaerales bacterium]|nr:HAMP domain-containing histidine kinase [Phycisphaerales bacterium]
MVDSTELKFASADDESDVAADTAFSPRVGWLTLPLKTTVILAFLLVGAVVLCGKIFIRQAENMLHDNKTRQLSQMAYALSTTLRDEEEQQAQLETLQRMPNFEFAVITDDRMRINALFVDDMKSWRAYTTWLADRKMAISSEAGEVRKIPGNNKVSYVLTVPIARTTANGPSVLYLHMGSGGESILAQLQFLQASVLFTSMIAVLLVVPIAWFVARHLTVPVQQLVKGAQSLGDGDLAYRVRIRRSDELGELGFAFNHMAETLQLQQENIQLINANLEKMIEARTEQLQQVNHRLTAEMAEKEDFLRAVSHDLNAPLRNIAGMTSMLLMKYGQTLEADAIQRLERIQKNVDTQSELINELLELSRIKSRREKIELVDLHELLTTLADNFAGDLETKRITLTISGRLPIMKCEKMRLRQVFQNLIDNAIKYMREDGPRTIGVSVRWEPQEVVVSVKDTGMGIATDELPNLFHVFRRAKNATMMKIPGKGVGLASVKAIVENYHGRLWADSQAGEGTTFHMAIPKTHFELAEQEVA